MDTEYRFDCQVCGQNVTSAQLHTAEDCARFVQEHEHIWRTEGDGNYEPFVRVCEDCGAVDE